MTRILVTGVNGQLGCEIARLLGNDEQVRLADRKQCDMNDLPQLRRTIANMKPALIINTAAYTAVDAAESDEATAMRVNAEAPAVMANELRRYGGSLIHFSTDYVFDGEKRQPYRESDSPAPLSVYGRSKLAGETAIVASGVSHLIFRTAWLYSHRARNFVLTMLRLFREQPLVRVVDDQIGTPTYAADVARFINDRVVNSDGDRFEDFIARRAGVYHLCNRGCTTWFGFAQAILDGARTTPALAATLGSVSLVPIASWQYQTAAARPRYAVLDSSLAQTVFHDALPDWRLSMRACLDRIAVEMQGLGR